MTNNIIKQNSILLLLLVITLGCIGQKEPTPEQQKVINQAKANFVFVEGGDFMMGKDYLAEASPAHQVTLDSYSISKYETTFEEYDVYTELNGLDKIDSEYRHISDMGPNYGAKYMTWQQARDYCFWLGQQLDLPLDLPTEAQWEYAARSRGLDVAHATDSGKIEGSYTEKRNYLGSEVEVGTYAPNPLGLYDMSGGRPEWTRDWRMRYTKAAATNPVYDSIHGAKTRVVRGFHTLVNSVYRRGFRNPNQESSGVGFRCTCNQKTPVN